MTALIWTGMQIWNGRYAILMMLVLYEGVPLVREILFLDRVPVVRDLLVGRVNIAAAEAARGAREGYVSLSEKTAVEAKLAEMERQLKASAQALQEYQKSAASDRDADRLAAETAEKAIAEDNSEDRDDGSRWTDADRRWLCEQRATPYCRR